MNLFTRTFCARIATISSFFIGMAGSLGANASGELDQSIEPLQITWVAAVGKGELAQTFMVAAGGQLSELELLLARNGNSSRQSIVVEIRRTTNGVPNNSNNEVLGSVLLDVGELSNNFAFTHVDFSASDITVSAGEVLAVTVRAESGQNNTIARWAGTSLSVDQYADGAAYQRMDGKKSGAWLISPSQSASARVFRDLSLKSYIDATPVPDPVFALAAVPELPTSEANTCGSSLSSVDFVPMNDISIRALASSVGKDNRFMSVSDEGAVLALDNSGSAFVWSELNLSKLGLVTGQCDTATYVDLSSDGNRALFGCYNGRPTVAVSDGAVFTSGTPWVYGAYVSDIDMTIASKDANVVNLKPSTASIPQQLQPRVAIRSSSNYDYTITYFSAPELDHGRVRAISPDGAYVSIEKGDANYIVKLSDQTLVQIDESVHQFATNYFVANDGRSAVGVEGGCGWVCKTSTQVWRQSSGTDLINQAPGLGTWYGNQDMSADACLVAGLEYSEGPIFGTLNRTGNIWLSGSGSQRIEDFVLQYGGNSQGWSNLIPVAVSQNGRYIVGVGTNSAGQSNKGFMLKLNH